MAAPRSVSRSLLGQFWLLNPSSAPPASHKPVLALLIPRRGITSRLYVGGLSFSTTQNGLLEAFSQYGQVIEAVVVTDRVSSRSKGFGFVTFASENEAQKALTEMDGKPLHGRVVSVDYARPRSDFGGGMPIARGPPEPKRIDKSNDDTT